MIKRPKKEKDESETSLNWNNFDWGQFQTLSVRIAEAIFSDCNFDPYLKQGQKQDGLDIISFSRTNGKFLGIQCKREQKKWSTSDIDGIINEMLAGYYKDKLSDFIISTSTDLQNTRMLRHINECKLELSKRYGITFECWDRQTIESKLKNHWNLVVYYFGRTQADEFCYPQLQHSSLDIKDVDDYIPRKVIEFTESDEADDIKNFWRHFHKKFFNLKDPFLEDRQATRRICLIGQSHQGKSYYIKHAAYELKQAGLRIQPLLIEVKSHNIQPIETLLSHVYGSWRNIPYKDMVVFIDGLDEVPTDRLIEMLKYIHEFSISNRSISIVLSCRTLFYNHYKASSIIPLFDTYELGHYDYDDISTFLNNKLKEHAKAFDEAISRNNLRSLLYQPFYLINLTTDFLKPPHKLSGGRIQVLENCLDRSFEIAESRQIKGSDQVRMDSVLFKKSIKRFAFALQLAGKNALNYNEIQELFTSQERVLLQHNPIVSVSGVSWSFTNALYQEHLAASLLLHLNFVSIVELCSIGTGHRKIKTKWIQTISSLLSLLDSGDSLFTDLLTFVENDNIELIFQSESSKFTPEFRLLVLQKLMTRCRKQNIRPIVVYEEYIGAFIENTPACADYLIDIIVDPTCTDLVKIVAIRILRNTTASDVQKKRYKEVGFLEIATTSNSQYAGELVDGFTAFKIGDHAFISQILGMDQIINQHPFRDQLYELIIVLNLVDHFYSFGLQGIQPFLEYNKQISHGGSETNLQDFLLATRDRHHLAKLLSKSEDSKSFIYLDYRGSHKDNFLKRLFQTFGVMYISDPLIIIPIAKFIKDIGKRYLRDEMIEVDKFLEKTNAHSFIVRLLIKDIMEDNSWELGGLITPETYDYVLFEFEDGNYGIESLRNCMYGMRHKQKDKFDNEFYQLCNDVSAGEIENATAIYQYSIYQEAERKKRENDLIFIQSLDAFKIGIGKYFADYGKKSIPEHDLFVDSDMKTIRHNSDSYFLFDYFLRNAPRDGNVIREKDCLLHISNAGFFEMFRTHEILRYSMYDEASKTILLDILKEFYNKNLPLATFINCKTVLHGNYKEVPLPNILGDIFEKFKFQTEEKYLLEFLWLDTGGSRNFDETLHAQPHSISRLIIERLDNSGIVRLRQKVVKNMETGIDLEIILGSHIALCKKYQITEAKEMVLAAVKELNSDSNSRIDATTAYLDLGGNVEEIAQIFRDYTAYDDYYFLHLAVTLSKKQPHLVIQKLTESLDSALTLARMKMHHAEILMEIGAWNGFAYLVDDLRKTKFASEHAARGRSISHIDTVKALAEIDDIMYLLVDDTYYNTRSFHDTARHVMLDWLYQLAAKSEKDLALVSVFLENCREKLMETFPDAISINWYINNMAEKFRDSDKTIRSIKEIKQILNTLDI